MRFLGKLLGWTVAVVATLAVVQSLLLWNAARQDYARAEAQVAAAIEKGWTVVEFKDLPNLRKLPANLSALPGLTRFQAQDTDLSDLSLLAGFSELAYLDIRGSRVTDLSPVSGLPKLKHVVINGTRVRDLGPLATLPSLERLGMAGTQVASLEPLTRAKALNWVNLHAAYAEDGSLTHFDELTERVAEVNNGRAFRMNYVPDAGWLRKVRINRLAEDFGLPEPFPRAGA